MKVFKTEEGQVVNAISYSLDILKKNKDVKVYVGTDSQNRKYDTKFITVIAYRSGHRGVHYIYFVSTEKKFKSKESRLWREVELSVEVAQWLEDRGIKVFCIDLDLNEKITAGSNNMMAASRGYVIGLGFNCTIKPEEQVATRAADHLVRN